MTGLTPQVAKHPKLHSAGRQIKTAKPHGPHEPHKLKTALYKTEVHIFT